MVKITFEIDEQGDKVVNQVDKQLVVYALDKFNDHYSNAAKWLGITPRGLQKKRNRHNLPMHSNGVSAYRLTRKGAPDYGGRAEMWRRYPDE